IAAAQCLANKYFTALSDSHAENKALRGQVAELKRKLLQHSSGIEAFDDQGGASSSGISAAIEVVAEPPCKVLCQVCATCGLRGGVNADKCLFCPKYCRSGWCSMTSHRQAS
ncbi:unnamed protein product, partial [Polarella glacialis]